MSRLRMIVVLSLMLVAIARKRRYRTRIRRYGVRPFNKLRKLHGQYETMVKYIKTNDEKEFFSYTRMTPAMFDHLLMLVEPKVRKHPSRKNALCPSFRLCLTLHYLAEGCSMKEISRNYYIGKATAHVIIREICTVLWDVLKDIYIPEPTIERMVEVSKGFYRRWNMPNCLGALDGKHVSIQAPYHSGSEYFSYKKSFSLVLMAACDSYYKFIYVDIAAPGSLHDSYIFRQSNFGRAFLSNEFEDRLPQAKVLPNSNIVLPYFLVADQSLPVA
ncbi:putative nuclease HARBI1 [Photinus pyralis]|uniref:putative nuclease HARBI1 n=1 Tax=Photinus pyralis TaxID=7054 RepID=UPI001267057C|nr:putative nuclease HARBI1 [Photinus pyralis]